MNKISNRILCFILFVALVWACLFRLVSINHVEPTNPDEAMYLRQARFISGVAFYCTGNPGPVLQAGRSGIWRYVRKDDWYSKPCWAHSALFSVPVMVGMPLLISGMAVNAFFSLLGVIMVFLIGRRINGVVSGVTAAAFLCVSYYWLLYTRSFMAEIDSTVFSLLAVWFLISGMDVLRGWWWRVALAGVFAAMAALCHYRLLYICVMLAAIVPFWYQRHRFYALTVFAFSGVLFVVFLDLVMRVGASSLASDFPFSGVIGALIERYFPDSASETNTAFQPQNILVYIWYMVRYQGIAIIIMAGLGCWQVLRNRSQQGRSIALIVMITLLILSCQKWIVARAGVLMVPYVCILAGIGLAWLAKLQRSKTVTLGVFCIVIFIAAGENIFGTLRLLSNKYGYAEVASYLQREKAQVVYADSEGLRIIEFFIPDLRCRGFNELKQGPVAGDFVVFDNMRYHSYPPQRKQLENLEIKIASQIDCVFNTPHLTKVWPEFLRDGTQAHTFDQLSDSIDDADDSLVSSIRVYGTRHR